MNQIPKSERGGVCDYSYHPYGDQQDPHTEKGAARNKREEHCGRRG